MKVDVDITPVPSGFDDYPDDERYRWLLRSYNEARGSDTEGEYIVGYYPDSGILWAGRASNPVDALTKYALREGFGGYWPPDLTDVVNGVANDVGTYEATRPDGAVFRGACATFTNYTIFARRVP